MAKSPKSNITTNEYLSEEAEKKAAEKKRRDAIRKKLRYGDRAIIAKATDYSEDYVSRVLNGTRAANESILSAAETLIERREILQNQQL